MGRKRTLVPYAFVAPAALIILFVSAFALIYTIYLSLTDADVGVLKLQFVGLKNYASLFKQPEISLAFQKTFIFTFGTIAFSIVCGVACALGLSSLRQNSIYQPIILLPWAVAEVIAALLWRSSFTGGVGVVPYLLDRIGLQGIDFLSQSAPAMVLLILAQSWRDIGFVMIFVMAALQFIDSNIQEAARIDGANGRQIFARITLPLIRPTIVTLVLLLSIECFNLVGLILVLTGGGPALQTQTLSLYMYKEAFRFFRIARGSAIAVVIGVTNLLLVLIYLKLFNREERLF